MSFAATPLRSLTFGKVAQVMKTNCTLANYNAWLDKGIASYYSTYVATGSIAPYFHCMAAASALSIGALYPHCLEEHIEKNPRRFWRGQLGLDMGDYMAPEPNHHFTKVLKTDNFTLTSGGH